MAEPVFFLELASLILPVISDQKMKQREYAMVVIVLEIVAMEYTRCIISMFIMYLSLLYERN